MNSTRPTTNDEYPVRLQKHLARAGVASRRGSEDLISSGRVTVNGEVITLLGSKIIPAHDVVAVDGVEIRTNADPVYLMLNKPAGYISTMSDPHARHTVAELVPTDQYPGLFPIGRLDADTTGLLLFTTDGELAHRIMHPHYEVHKRYDSQVERRLRDGEIQWLSDGVMLDDGLTAPALVKRIEPFEVCEKAIEGEVDHLSLCIHEGRKRQIRRMLDTIGHPVITLQRVAIGDLELGDLELGSWRLIDRQDIETLIEM
ncbi:MAG: rRNA pseudouridine synthase [Actinomycetia bacterium]|nr:rRNA pseudouridine synthase [Actinomycetes bacterium]